MILTCSSVVSQSIRINEVVASNATHLDEDGDTPDWLELHNFGTNAVSLQNWTITDDVSNVNQWSFPNVSLQPDEYLLLWASSKDRAEASFARTLVNEGDTFKYIIPSSEPSVNWKDISFDDTAWLDGISGFGYDDGDDNTILPVGTASVYTRIKFNVSDVNEITNLLLDIDYDDGFVAYINGNEVARANITGVNPAFNQGTITDHEAQMYTGGNPERFTITDFSNLLVNGDNVLAIQVHNINNASSDLTLIPFLSAIYNSNSTEGVEPPGILNLTSILSLHTDFKIASTSETITLINDTGVIVDQLLLEGLQSDISYGYSNSSNDYVYFIDTTPSLVNSNTEFSGITNSEIIFSHNGGLLTATANVALSGNSIDEQIRYTLDATEPNFSSVLYTNPIEVSLNTVIRAKVFQQNYIPSQTASRTYIFNANHDLDIVTLVTEPDNLFDNNTGIYVFGDSYDTNQPNFGANFWEDWERPIYFSMYKNDTGLLEIDFNAGIKIFGGWSRANNQRSLSIFARGKYGTSEIEYPFFEDLDYDKFQALVLRNSGQDWLKSSIKDRALTSLMQDSGLDYLSNKPVVAYINGEYWGHYTIREKTNEHMLASKHNVDADDINLLESNGVVIEGSNEDYLALLNYINTTDLVSDTNFQYVEDRIDITNYALYQATQIFFANTDWPGNNIKYWNHPSGKWRWILYDTDFCFGPFWDTDDFGHDTLSFALEENGPNWPNPEWSTLLFRKLVTNIGFRNKFINRYADELNTRFLSNNVKNHFDAIFSEVQSEILAHYTRWEEDPNVAAFFVNEMKIYADNRPAIVKDHIQNKFNLPARHEITITNNAINQGFVEINNNLEIQLANWSGDYFESVPIELKAIAESGFEFSHWSGAINSTDAIISIDMLNAMTVTPNFVPSAIAEIVINEINYKAGNAQDSGDWIELYNPNNVALSLSNWVFKDSDDTHSFVFPINTNIDANSYLIITKNATDFLSVFPSITNTIGDFDFGLGTSDSVRLYNNNGVLQDEVVYSNANPWPDCANGFGPSLELIASELDNSLPENWNCINVIGSPNVENNLLLSVNDVLTDSIKFYPNPVNDILYVDGIKEPFKAEIYNVLGERISSGEYTKQIDCSTYANGVYIVKLLVKGQISVHKMVKK